MKKLISAVSVAAICFLISCNSKESGGMSAKAKKNLEASRVVSDAFTSGDPSKIDSVVAPDFVDHTDRFLDSPIDAPQALPRESCRPHAAPRIPGSPLRTTVSVPTQPRERTLFR